ncbi:MAG: hypothetical protein KC417_17535, partial [Myxococcales bacterium]|nr:hypothetical protein [Myxococcales bacterium]
EIQIGRDTVTLRRSENGWVFADEIASPFDQSTPRNAIHAFVRAVEGSRWDVLLRFAPAAEAANVDATALRERWSTPEKRAELARLAGALRMAWDSPIEQNGDEASMAYAGQLRVSLIREAGVWKIADPD